jgi:hypothetical protein
MSEAAVQAVFSANLMCGISYHILLPGIIVMRPAFLGKESTVITIPDQPVVLFSIGHSNQTIESFLTLLHYHQFHVLLDVRSNPYSRYVPHFNAHPLRFAIQQAGMTYVFLGKKLGGRPEGDEFYDADNHVLYDRLSSSPFFLEGIERIIHIGRKYNAVILCSEENPAVCHRHLLIGRVLRQQGCTLRHIRGDGRLQTEADLAFQESAFSSGHSLWEESLAPHEAKAWKSVQPVLRNKQLFSSSANSHRQVSNASSTYDETTRHN